MSTECNRPTPKTESKTPVCGDCGYNPIRSSELLAEALAETDYDRPYIEVSFGLNGEGRALLCPVCGNLVRRTD
jgi:hypothetical protein